MDIDGYLYSPCFDTYRSVTSNNFSADASSYGIGGVIYHFNQDGSERTIEFASRTVSDTKKIFYDNERSSYNCMGLRSFLIT